MKRLLASKAVISAITSFLLFGLIWQSSEIKLFAQINLFSDCPGLDPRSIGWQKLPDPLVRQLTYFINPFGANGYEAFNGTEINEINAGFDEWSAASLRSCIKVNFTRIFSPTDPNSQENNSNVFVHLGGSPDGRSEAAVRVIQSDHPYVYGADIYMEMNQFNRNDPSFANMMLKATLHEIGHTMGLADVEREDRTKLKSVMNVYEVVQ